MNFRIAQFSDIDDIVKFHKKNFENYYLTNLGEKILNKYYSFFIKNKNNFCNICEIDDKIVAISLYIRGYDEQMSQFYLENKIILSKAVLINLFSLNKVIIKGTTGRLSNIFNKETPSNLPETTLLSLATDSDYQSKGIGRLLIIDSEKIMVRRGVNNYYLSVLPQNEGAIKFYKNNGFVQIKKTKKLIYLMKQID